MNESQGYQEAFEELQLIVREIEDGDISIDQLSEKVKRAALLISICRKKLNETEADVTQVLNELDTDNSDAI